MGRQAIQLKKDMKRIVSNLDQRWLKAAAGQVCANLSRLVNQITANTGPLAHLLGWIPFYNGEPDITRFIAEQMELRQVYLPRVTEAGELQYISVEQDWKQDSKSSFLGIPEPSLNAGSLFDPINSDSAVILVSGLIFDRFGNRLGRDKSAYERFLSRPSLNSVIKVGVCWTIQMMDELPPNNSNLVLDYIVHEEGIVKSGVTFVEELEEE